MYNVGMSLDLSKLTVFCGDCSEELKKVGDASVDLVVTSPPYAEQRKGKYNSIPMDRYLEWFLPIGKELKRVIRPTGSFFLNIKGHCDHGEWQTYHWDLVKALQSEVGFKYIDEYIWYKSCLPSLPTRTLIM